MPCKYLHYIYLIKQTKPMRTNQQSIDRLFAGHRFSVVGDKMNRTYSFEQVSTVRLDQTSRRRRRSSWVEAIGIINEHLTSLDADGNRLIVAHHTSIVAQVIEATDSGIHWEYAIFNRPVSGMIRWNRIKFE